MDTTASDQVSQHTLSCTAANGTVISATVHGPASMDNAIGAVVIANAIGTPGRFYEPLARWLAARGYLALTLDLQGTEPESLRSATVSLIDWADDLDRLLAVFADGLAADLPLTWIGHSLGGQLIPMIDHSRIDSLVLVASGSGHWRFNTSRQHAAWAMWHLVPAITTVFGYFPGQRIAGLGDLPTPAARQWARWCLHPEYMAADVDTIRDRYASVTCPVTTVWMSDDEILREDSLKAIEKQLTSAQLTRVLLGPADSPRGRIGHHGFFRAHHNALWERHLTPALAR